VKFHTVMCVRQHFEAAKHSQPIKEFRLIGYYCPAIVRVSVTRIRETAVRQRDARAVVGVLLRIEETKMITYNPLSAG